MYLLYLLSNWFNFGSVNSGNDNKMGLWTSYSSFTLVCLELWVFKIFKISQSKEYVFRLKQLPKNFFYLIKFILSVLITTVTKRKVRFNDQIKCLDDWRSSQSKCWKFKMNIYK